MKASIFGIIFLCSISIFSSAQSVQKQGYLVLNNGDTLLGWIDYRNWEKNPAAISFTKDALSNGATKYSKFDIQAAEITGLDRYIKAIIEKDARPVTFGELLPSDKDSLITDTVLLRVLVDGSLFDLYELHDSKIHFFIKKWDEQMRELKYKVNISDDNTAFDVQKLFINQLKGYLSGASYTSDLINKIDDANYKEKDLAHIITEMNKISGTVTYTVAGQKKKILTSFFAGAGGGYSNVAFAGSNPILENMKFSGGFSPFATVGIDISSSRNLQAITMRMEASFSHAAYAGKGTRGVSGVYTNSYTVTQTNISPTASLLFSFIRNESVKIYAGAGAAWNISSYGKNVYTETNGSVSNKEIKDYLSFPSASISPLFKLGAKFSNKMSVEIDARFMSSMTNYISWSLTPQTFTGQFRYYF